jgi:hypothetical protein
VDLEQNVGEIRIRSLYGPSSRIVNLRDSGNPTGLSSALAGRRQVRSRPSPSSNDRNQNRLIGASLTVQLPITGTAK